MSAAKTPQQIAAELGMPGMDDSHAAAAGVVDAPADLDALLNESLDDIPDLADYVVPMEGAYRFHVDKVDLNAEIGEKKSKAIQIDYTITELLQTKEGGLGDPVKVGDKFSNLYFMSTQKGAAYNQGVLKKLLQPVALRLGVNNLKLTLEGYSGMDVIGVVKNKRDRQDRDVIRSAVVKIAFAE